MKTLVIYYSFEGNTAFIANHIAKATGGDTLQLCPDKEPNTHGFMKYVWGGKQVITKEVPKLQNFDKNPEEYDLVFIGTPVWAFTYTPALQAFFHAVSLKGKNIALFCCSHGSIGKTFDNMQMQLVGNNILGQIDFVQPAGKAGEAAKATKWAQDILSALHSD